MSEPITTCPKCHGEGLTRARAAGTVATGICLYCHGRGVIAASTFTPAVMAFLRDLADHRDPSKHPFAHIRPCDGHDGYSSPRVTCRHCGFSARAHKRRDDRCIIIPPDAARHLALDCYGDPLLPERMTP